MILENTFKAYYFKLFNTVEEFDILFAAYVANKEKWNAIREDDDFQYKSFYLEINDIEGFVICNDEYLKKWIAYYDLIGYNYTYYSADDLLFKGEIDLSLADDKLKNTIEQYIFNNFDVNDVLDKINNKVKSLKHTTNIVYKIYIYTCC